MKKPQIVVNILIVLLIIIQLHSYVAALQGQIHPKLIEQELPKPGGRHLIAYFSYWFGVNLFVIPIFILFIISRNMKRKLIKRKLISHSITEIGKS